MVNAMIPWRRKNTPNYNWFSGDKLTTTLNWSSIMDSTTRFEHAVQSLQAVILDKLEPSLVMLQALKDWKKVSSKQMIDTHKVSKRQYSDSIGVAKFFLGKAGERMCCYVRNELHIPFVDEEYFKSSECLSEKPNSYQSIGNMVTAVYERMRSGELYSVAIECLNDVEGGRNNESNK